jgi:hypothetical protein
LFVFHFGLFVIADLFSAAFGFAACTSVIWFQWIFAYSYTSVIRTELKKRGKQMPLE